MEILDEVKIREMIIEDYYSVFELWRNTEGIGLSEADSRENISLFLQRNPGFSLIAQKDNEIIGVILCGHDGRRGYFHHLVVRKDHRLKGLGRKLVKSCLKRLNLAGIDKCHIFVFWKNELGQRFWTADGWETRHDLNIMSKLTIG